MRKFGILLQMWMSVRAPIQFVISMPTALTLTAAISAPVEVDIQEMVYSAMVKLMLVTLCFPLDMNFIDFIRC